MVEVGFLPFSPSSRGKRRALGGVGAIGLLRAVWARITPGWCSNGSAIAQVAHSLTTFLCEGRELLVYGTLTFLHPSIPGKREHRSID